MQLFQAFGNGTDKFVPFDDGFAFRCSETEAFFDHYVVFGNVARADFQNNRSALAGPFPELVNALTVTFVDFDPDLFAERRLLQKFFLQPFDIFHNRIFVGVVLNDRYDDNLIRRNLRRHDHAFVVGMSHDDAADKAGRNAPGRSIGIFLLIIFVNERNVC